MNGDWGAPIKRVVVVEFPDRAAIAATFADPDYPALGAIREASARSRSIIVEGIDAPVASPREIVDAAMRAWMSGDEAAFWQLLADDVQYEVIGTTPVSGRYDGRKAFLTHALAPMAALLTRSALPIEYDLLADGDRVVLMWRGSGTMLNGASYDNSYCWILTVVEGRIAAIKAYLDTALVDALFNQPTAIDDMN